VSVEKVRDRDELLAAIIGFDLLSLPLCMGECWRVRQLSCASPAWFIHVDGKKAEGSSGALGF
jgi:hypothetical protein